MCEEYEIRKAKIDSLLYGFTDMGYRPNNRIGQYELLQFLKKRTISGMFDTILADKLFQMICLDKVSTMPIEEFISGYIQFEDDMKRNVEAFNIKLNKEKEIYANLAEQCMKYKTEKLNEEGMCENAKISGEITDIDIKQKLEGIREIIIKVIYNEKSEEFHFKMGDLNSNDMLKKFEFKPTSRKDHFEFIMKGVNDHNKLFDIGSKVFPLTEINSQEEYIVQIVIPEIENEEKAAAFIHAKIVLFWSDYKYYEHQKRKSEKRIQKLTKAFNKAKEYLQILTEIYGDLTKKQADLLVEFNNEKLMQNKGSKFHVDFNNVREEEDENFMVEFNNIREIKTEKPPINVEFNNTKEVLIRTEEIKNEIVEEEEKNRELKEQADDDKNPNPNEKEEEEAKNEEEQNEEKVEEQHLNVDLNNQGDNVNIATEQENIETQEQNQINYEQFNADDLVQTGGEQFGEAQGVQVTGAETQNFDFGNYNTTTEMTDEYQKSIFQLVGQAGGENNVNVLQENNYGSSVNEAIINNATNKTLVKHMTLTTKVLPVKINKVIVDSNVKTLPVIVHPTKVTYSENYQTNFQNLGY